MIPCRLMKACETVYRTLARQTNLPEFKEPIMISTAPSCAILTPLSVKEARFYFYTLLFVTGNIAFPAICHLAPNGGPTLLPIYFFTLIAGYRFGWPAALATAILSPVANHFLTGMPPASMLSVILAKSILLAFFASTAARLFGLSFPAVALAVLGYQVTGGMAEWIITGSWTAALADFRVGLPGILFQLIGGYAVLRLLCRRD